MPAGTQEEASMSDRTDIGPLQPGERAPNVVLDAITREGKIAIDDFRGEKPLLVGLFRGLHCPFCRRHIAALAQLSPALRERGVESLTVVNTPIERARLYFRYHPVPEFLAASDPQRESHRAFGLPNLEFTQGPTVWPYKVAISDAAALQVDIPGETPGPMGSFEAAELLARKDGYEMTPVDQQMDATGKGQLVGQFLLDRNGIVRWTFTEVAEGGRHMFGGPTTDEVMSAAMQVA
jgi:peroxiredoxin